ncbi:uncharacterized protein LOC131959994 isoform X2 [Centropristis striata]|uniref:uncharacterized protein LOC131959994 isoform X2 n=1 Tax=Centropristis striata TaxID=184440 RepID=UPI0027E1D823|nr:uncharacterized protein LOC131959994 isoform X2 [Centropristis striata]
MKAHLWNCVLGLLCMPAEVLLSSWTVSQDPLSISLMRTNSAAEITCTTSLPDPLGFVLYRRFNGERELLYLSLSNGRVTKNTTAAEFVGRIHVVNHQIRKGHGFTLRLSLLWQEDTDLYYCSWKHFRTETKTVETMPSKGTKIIVRERDPQEQCGIHIVDLVLIALCVTSFTVILILCLGALIWRCKRKSD